MPAPVSVRPRAAAHHVRASGAAAPWSWFAYVLVAAGPIVAHLVVPGSVTADLVAIVGLVTSSGGILVAGLIDRPLPRSSAWYVLGTAGLSTVLWLVLLVLRDTGRMPPEDELWLVGLAPMALMATALTSMRRQWEGARDVVSVLDDLTVAVPTALVVHVALLRQALDVRPALVVVQVMIPIASGVVAAAAVNMVLSIRRTQWADAVLGGGAMSVLVGVVIAGPALGGTGSRVGSTVVLIGWATCGVTALHPAVRTATRPLAPPPGGSAVRIGIAAALCLVPPALAVVSHLRSTGSGASTTDAAMAIAASVASLVVVGALAARVVVLSRRLGDDPGRDGESRFAAMVEFSSDVITLLDERLGVQYSSRSAGRVLGLRPDQLVGVPLVDLAPESGRDALRSWLERAATAPPGQPHETECSVVRSDGVHRRVEVVASNLPVEDGGGGLVVTLRDVTEQRSLESELSRQAFHDALTGLANRVLFVDKVDRALRARAAGALIRPAVMFIDLDDFKAVNDGLGHAAGDQLLRGVAHRVRSCVGEDDTVARLGGDEFAILLAHNETELSAVTTAQRVLDALSRPMDIEGFELTVLASIGVAVAEGDTSTAWLMRDADIAMYAAKRHGKAGWQLFEPSMREPATDRLAMKADLAVAVEERQLVVAYQPIVDLRTGLVRAAESLVRWNHPTRGFVPPSEFVGFAEESGQILQIGRWILQTACQQAARWQSPSPGVTVSVNVSGVQLADAGFIPDVAGALERSGLPPELLTIEVTETVLMQDADRAALVLQELRRLGVRVSIDDFGTGYCSLAYLQRFAVDALKIDRSFVTGLATDDRAASLARSIVQMATTMGLRCIAEGIETTEQLRLLRSWECDLGQGFLFSQPLTGDELDRYIGEVRRRVSRVSAAWAPPHQAARVDVLRAAPSH